MSVLIVIGIILGMIIVVGIIASVRALQCPNCYKNYKWNDKKRYNMLVWQDAQQRDICKYCSWTVDAKDFTPPQARYLKWLDRYSPLKLFNPLKK